MIDRGIRGVADAMTGDHRRPARLSGPVLAESNADALSMVTVGPATVERRIDIRCSENARTMGIRNAEFVARKSHQVESQDVWNRYLHQRFKLKISCFSSPFAFMVNRYDLMPVT